VYKIVHVGYWSADPSVRTSRSRLIVS
jgi:hypothetical protein